MKSRVGAGAAAVWTGLELVVWGGASSGPLDSGGRYNPVLNEWKSMSTVDNPGGRAGPTAVWAGLEMIVFGGSVPTLGGQLSSGGRYVP